jgi:multidrug resistance efflux pump
MLFYLLAVGSIVAASIIGTGWIHLGNSSGDNREAPPINSNFIMGFGYVDTQNGIISLSPSQLGTITHVLVKENQEVKKNAVLLRVDNKLAKLKVDEAFPDLTAAQAQQAQAEAAPDQMKKGIDGQKASVEAAKFDLARAEAALKEVDRLIKAGVGPSAEKREEALQIVKKAEAAIKIEEAKLKVLELKESQLKRDIERAKSDVEAKKARWEQAKYAVEECELKAPCDGKVLRLMVSVGDFMGPGPREPAIFFCPSESRIIRAEVEQEFANKIKEGAKVVVQDDARESGEWHGEVQRISDWFTQRRSIRFEPKQLNDVRTLECIIKLDDPKGLRIGQRVRVIFGK